MTISEQSDLLLNEKSRELRNEFNQLITDYQKDLWNYCRYLTGSPWDGEDLFQETVLKALGGFYQRWHPTNPKSYLYRVATNTWIDQCRREKRNIGVLHEADEPTEDFSDNLELEQALEHLINIFPPRQIAVFLLLEVFKFTAHEVASIIKTTSGAVYATIRRMKVKLMEHKEPTIQVNQTPSTESNQKVIQAYLKAFNEGDLEAMLDLISDHAHNEASLGFQEFSKDEMRNGSMKYGLPGNRAEEIMLWGKPAIAVFAEEEDKPVLHDIQYQEIENGKIVYHRSYFFRKEFIFAAAKELGVPPQLIKPPVNWA